MEKQIIRSVIGAMLVAVLITGCGDDAPSTTADPTTEAPTTTEVLDGTLAQPMNQATMISNQFPLVRGTFGDVAGQFTVEGSPGPPIYTACEFHVDEVLAGVFPATDVLVVCAAANSPQYLLTATPPSPGDVNILAMGGPHQTTVGGQQVWAMFPVTSASGPAAVLGHEWKDLVDVNLAEYQAAVGA
ncbi:MAG TPA: hypothetical protein VJM33_04180 [Microthrixaceae bacterium]|nr:hypothetical protein [Microthrixaceae bacterium]